jgi:hypothetical protein
MVLRCSRPWRAASSCRGGGGGRRRGGGGGDSRGATPLAWGDLEQGVAAASFFEAVWTQRGQQQLPRAAGSRQPTPVEVVTLALDGTTRSGVGGCGGWGGDVHRCDDGDTWMRAGI